MIVKPVMDHGTNIVSNITGEDRAGQASRDHALMPPPSGVCRYLDWNDRMGPELRVCKLRGLTWRVLLSPTIWLTFQYSTGQVVREGGEIMRPRRKHLGK
ncbi:hypothetical protein RRG08_040935 [Elysia crispata]|uniref:Uncharacterized protein n=1 Tax=Elysia crispata TaxID=231223 RepID=A0AAE0XQL0_9GAST|nr:hypothetical protein RRG08_040935 [Elysia crispata]